MFFLSITATEAYINGVPRPLISGASLEFAVGPDHIRMARWNSTRVSQVLRKEDLTQGDFEKNDSRTLEASLQRADANDFSFSDLSRSLHGETSQKVVGFPDRHLTRTMADSKVLHNLANWSSNWSLNWSNLSKLSWTPKINLTWPGK